MILRTRDPDVIREAIKLYPYGDISLACDDWTSNEDNYAYVDDRGNVGMFEAYIPKVYTGHYFFKDRGSSVPKIAVEMLSEIFKRANGVRGLTPIEHLPAQRVTRYLGFEDLGEVTVEGKDYTIFYMTKDEFKRKWT